MYDDVAQCVRRLTDLFAAGGSSKFWLWTSRTQKLQNEDSGRQKSNFNQEQFQVTF